MSFDINDPELLNEPIEVEGEVSSEDFFKPVLPDEGDYISILRLGDRGIKVDRQKEGEERKRTGKPYLNVHFALELQGENGEKVGTAFDQATSIVMPNMGTSRLHAIMDLAGSPIPARSTLGEVLNEVETTLAQNPQIGATIQWLAQIEDTSKPEGSKERYRLVLRGQKKFPPILDSEGKPTGKYDPEVVDSKTGETVRAQIKVTKYWRAA